MELLDKSEPIVRELYDTILGVVSKFGSFDADEKKSSIHLVRGTGFAGIHPRKSAILLNIRTDSKIESPRIRKIEQVSKSRFHNEMLITSPKEVDREVSAWLRAAYDLASAKG